MSNYWVERQMTAKKKISEKTEADIKRQLNKYYSNAMKRTIADFEATYDKLLATVEEGREPTPADLYKLDKYWQSQAQLKKELQALGDKEVELLSKNFEKQWKKIYETTAIKSNGLFNTVSSSSAEQMINTSWLSDNKTFSQRIWGNIEKLTETLNEKLVDCVITGKKTTELSKILQERFNVSYNQADTLVRTEIANIQVQAAAQRYKDSGLKYYEFFADPDERTCSKCKALEGKKFLYSEMKPGVNAPPMHPRDRCDILPVIDNESEETIMNKEFDFESSKQTGFIFECKYCGYEWRDQYEHNFTTCSSCNKVNWNLKPSKTIYKDAKGNEAVFTDVEYAKESKRVAQEIQARARAKASAKTDKGKVVDDAYTTAPLKKQIKEAHESEGEFVYYTHHCPSCDRYFNSTVADKTRCPLCGEPLKGARWEAKEHTINNKICAHCGKLFDAEKDYNKVICDDCIDEILSSKESERLRKHGYTDKGIMEKFTGHSNGFNRGYSQKYLYLEYIEKHPEQEAELEKLKYKSDKYDNNFDEHHFIVCVDCGEVVFVENMNNAQKRCPDCQAKYRKWYKAQKEKERRARKKKK